MLSDHEQRALDELERSLAAPPSDASPPGGPPGPRRFLFLGRALLVTLCGVSAVLLVTGVPVAAVALAVATALGWLFCRACAQDLDLAGRRPISGRRWPGESIRAYLRWLSEAP